MNREASSAYINIKPQDVLALTTQTRIVDVREPHEWSGELGHLANAELVPLTTLAHRSPSWDRDVPLLVVCRSGGRSSQAASWLCKMGFSRIMNLSGGMIDYNAAGLPVVKE